MAARTCGRALKRSALTDKQNRLAAPRFGDSGGALVRMDVLVLAGQGDKWA